MVAAQLTGPEAWCEVALGPRGCARQPCTQQNKRVLSRSRGGWRVQPPLPLSHLGALHLRELVARFSNRPLRRTSSTLKVFLAYERLVMMTLDM